MIHVCYFEVVEKRRRRSQRQVQNVALPDQTLFSTGTARTQIHCSPCIVRNSLPGYPSGGENVPYTDKISFEVW